MKTCPQCGIEKPLSEFHKDKSRKSGLGCYCKSCVAKYSKEYLGRVGIKEKKNKRMREYYKRPEVKKRVAEYNKKYYQCPENKQKAIDRSNEYRTQNKEIISV